MRLLAPDARAGDFQLFRGDPKLIAPGVAVGAATTGAYFALHNRSVANRMSAGGAMGLTTVGCMALTPMVSAAVVQRELTRREVHEMLANCVIPFVGGWLIDAYFDAHPERDSAPPPVRVSTRHRHRH
ncbi:MAG TPA: hypothetical protein VKX28_15415 [Xanthobacteraceae bacterium]|nr:hypothetical protein [Xanthobacteraceae bacterium]